MRSLIPLSTLALQIALISLSNAQAPAKGFGLTDSGFTQAEIVRKSTPRYPRAELLAGIEGWVVFSVIIDEQGNVKEPILIDSSGNRNFEMYAKMAARKVKYTPATQNGHSIASSDNELIINFKIRKKHQKAYKGFLSRYHDIHQNIISGELEAASYSIKELESKHTSNRYEIAWLHMLKSIYYQKIGDTGEYIKQLKGAVIYGNQGLPKSILSNALISLYYAQAKNNLIADAFKTSKLIDQLAENSTEKSKALEHKVQLEKAIFKHPQFSIRGSISTSEAPWIHNLYRRTIGIETLSGKLDRLEIRCSNKTQTINLNKEFSLFKLPSDWKNCTAFIYGESSSELILLEQL
ncbi:energy transducer TonB [Pseudoteredinibacter isoporae]|uniref:TonB family protein n=1 Tax=Pseudoteredinibacter isoporae TaxID=570281 RepID=A0A7X0JTK9_9GAMM|nr:energy transducer TonB [Pseudoteredinibacter isoporae]MBB6521215.1 TonB family protein [Pseudoteredinibacter isoporae]NHO86775.1 energy transducer TonB [Pseudoteredinibacter isoporae]NIB24773.1 energy transducer TonB [Pseudoteredinibacter isoporae]